MKKRIYKKIYTRRLMERYGFNKEEASREFGIVKDDLDLGDCSPIEAADEAMSYWYGDFSS